ncbi:hypothetical protein TREMEDRAFT_13725, partial [Tremella mesenterica DSM 1558]
PAEAGPSKPKLGGYDFYHSIGSPKWVVAPMVDQSEMAWRLLSRSPLPPSIAGPSTSVTPASTSKTYHRHPGGAHLCYTPMIHAKVFAQCRPESRGGDGQFNLSFEEEGSSETLAGIEGGDRPLIVQFCGNDPEVLVKAARKVEHRCDAVDINLGCPQGIAKRGNYGAFLQDDWDLIHRIISTLHKNLSIPVTAKFRIFPEMDRTVAYAKMLEDAGAQIITCHGRTREMKGQLTGLADWQAIRAVKQAVKIPVFANGNILYRDDVDRCMEVTGCDGVMTAEGNLSNPAIFLPPDHPHFHPNTVLLARRYLDIVSSLQTPTANSAIKSHLFRLFKPILDQDDDGSLRQYIARSGSGSTTEARVTSFREVVNEIEKRQQPAVDKAGPDWSPPPIDPMTGYRTLPVFSAQPLIRASPISTEIGGNESFVDEESTLNQPSTPPTDPTRVQTPTPSVNGSNININIQVKCPHSDPTPCSAIAASRCSRGLCLLHCRQEGAVEGGMTPSEALAAVSAGLMGMGCEAHESKEAAKRERMAQKRKGRAETKKVVKMRK